MVISDHAKEVAIEKIFQRNDLNHENSRMVLSQLKFEWAGTGLRNTDLVDVLTSLFTKGVLLNDEYSGSKGVVLTAYGVRYMAESRQRFRNVLDYSTTLLMLQRVRRRSHRGGTSTGRRSGDMQGI